MNIRSLQLSRRTDTAMKYPVDKMRFCQLPILPLPSHVLAVLFWHQTSSEGAYRDAVIARPEKELLSAHLHPFAQHCLRRNGDCLARRKTVFENVACDSSTAQLTRSFILLKSFPSGYMLAVSINACPINADGIPKISSWCQQHSSNPHG